MIPIIKRQVIYKYYYTGIQTFQKYDFGLVGNWQRYGQLKPPTYNLTAVTCPVYMFYGLNDYLISPIVIII